jgi:hypothetical protein
LPNNHPVFDVRLQQAMDAIKLVYASIFSMMPRTYFESIDNKIEEEKMAIVLQEVVGNRYGDYYYPHISGTAQSHNYYPVAHMKPEEGFSVMLSDWDSMLWRVKGPTGSLRHIPILRSVHQRPLQKFPAAVLCC